MPSVVVSSSSASIWNMSSRGYVSRIANRSLKSWPAKANPERAITSAILRRNTGTSVGLAV